jgi:hypothetical protein
LLIKFEIIENLPLESVFFLKVFTLDGKNIYNNVLKRISSKYFSCEIGDELEVMGEIKIEIHKHDFTKVFFIILYNTHFL